MRVMSNALWGLAFLSACAAGIALGSALGILILFTFTA